MKNTYDLHFIKNRNHRHLTNTDILGTLSMLFVYGITAVAIVEVLEFLIELIMPLNFLLIIFNYKLFIEAIIVTILFILKWINNRRQYYDAIDNFLETYQAQLLFPTRHYIELFNIIEEICIGLGVKKPDVYLVNLNKFVVNDPLHPKYEHPRDKDAYDIKPFVNHLIQNNIFGLQLKNRTVLVINQDLLNNLDRYELAAIMAIEIGYTKNLFNTFLLYHHIMYDTLNKFVNVILGLSFAYLYGMFGGSKHSHTHVHFTPFELKFTFIILVIFVVFYIIKRIGYAIFHHHNLYMIKKLNASAIDLTQNPQILISALKKVNQNNYQPTGESMYNNLWVNPFTDESGDNKDPNFLMRLYLYVTVLPAALSNQFFNQQLRIPIDEQLQTIYDDYQIEPDSNDEPKTHQTDQELQDATQRDFDLTHIHIQDLNPDD